MITDIASAIMNSGFEEEAIININGERKQIYCIFQNEYERNIIAGVSYEGSNPVALVTSGDINGVEANRDSLRINNRTYYIREVKPDSKNFTLLELSYD